MCNCHKRAIRPRALGILCAGASSARNGESRRHALTQFPCQRKPGGRISVGSLHCFHPRPVLGIAAVVNLSTTSFGTTVSVWRGLYIGARGRLPTQESDPRACRPVHQSLFDVWLALISDVWGGEPLFRFLLIFLPIQGANGDRAQVGIFSARRGEVSSPART